MTPLIRALRTRHPEARITVVTRDRFAPLLAQSPRITEVIGWSETTPIRELGRRLKAMEFTHRLDTHGSLRSLLLRRLVGGRWTSYPKNRLARTVLIKTKKNIYRDTRHVVERYFDAARDLDVTLDTGSLEMFVSHASIDEANAFLAAQAIGTERQLIALAPGAAHFTKRWPLHHWTALVQRLVEAGNDIVVVGGTKEREVAASMESAALGRAVSAAGRFDLAGTGALLKRARALIAGDTGVMHMATAVGTPVVTMLGPTVQAFGFYPYHAKATVVERPLLCRPCSANGGPACPLKHHRCMQDLQPDMILDALRKLPR